MAPVDDSSHRAVPVVMGAGAAQHPQVVVEPGQQPVKAERAAACRRHSMANGIPSSRRQISEITARRPRSKVVASPAGRRRGLGLRTGADRVQAHRGQVNDPLAHNPEPLPTGGQHHDLGASGQDRRGEGGRGAEDVLAAIQDEQPPPGAQAFLHQLLQRLLRVPDNPEGGGHGLDDERRPTGTRSTKAPPAGNSSALKPATPGQPRLAHPARPHDGDQPAGSDGFRQLTDLSRPPDETGPLGRQADDLIAAKRA